MWNYIGLVHQNADSVSFPDFPGVVTAGTTLDDARAMAEEALAFHVESLVEDGGTIPEPSTLALGLLAFVGTLAASRKSNRKDK